MRMPRTDTPRLAILGAGPIGLEAALYAASLKLPVVVYERGRVGEYLQHWGHVRLFSPFEMNHTPLGRAAILAEDTEHDFPASGDCITGREHVKRYLEPLVKSRLLSGVIQTGVEVLHIGRKGYLKTEGIGDPKRAQQPFRLLLRDGKGEQRVEEADIVLDCTGTYGQHRWLGDGGIPALGERAAEQHVAYGLEDVRGSRRDQYAGKNVLVVGGGYSAATTVCNLVELAEEAPDTWVIWITRGRGSQPLKRIAADPLRERDRLAQRANTLATRTEGNIEFHNDTIVEAVQWQDKDRTFRVETCEGDATTKTWVVERIIANVGYTPNRDLYRELHIHECYASLGPMGLASALLGHAGDCLTAPAATGATLRNPEPNFYILGAKSYGRNAQFLLRTGFEQVREVFALVTGKAGLDLYKKR
jgi:thioredoxin reductase